MEVTTLLHSNFLQIPATMNHLETQLVNLSLNKVLADSPPETSFSNSSNHSFTGMNTKNSVKEIHAQIIKLPKKLVSDEKIQSLLTSYLELGDFQSAGLLLFTGFDRKDLYYKVFMEKMKRCSEILDVFCKLHSKGIYLFDSGNIELVLKICAEVMDLWFGLEIHACLIKKGLDLDVYIRCGLIDFYGVCWGTNSANLVFDESLDRDYLLWNKVISMNLMNENWEQGVKFFGEMQHMFMKSNVSTITKVLQACAKVEGLDEGKQIHGHVIRHAFDSNVLISNSLINMYMKNGCHGLARTVFDSMENRNLSSWNSIISGYAALGFVDEAWKLFCDLEVSNIEPDIVTWNSLLSGHIQDGSFLEAIGIVRNLQNSGCKPNSGTVSIILQATRELGFVNLGKEVHCYAMKFGLDHDLYVATSLLDMYGKNDCLKIARSVFNSMKNRNICAWNSLISGYVLNRNFEGAFYLLDRMKTEGIKPNLITYNILVSGYSVSGRMQEALTTIHEIENSGLNPNVVSWTALISGFSQNGYYTDAFESCIEMQKKGINPNSATLASLLQACAGLSVLLKGKEIHGFSIRNGLTNDIFVTTALIDMYSKCGSITYAYKVFKKFQNKTLACWNSMMAGFASCGLGKEAISLFEKMQEENTRPDSITFTVLLSSCKNSGLIKEGWKYFDSMTTLHSVTPNIEHYTCMVDLLGKSGYLDEAWDIVELMPLEPDAAVYGAILGSCRIHGSLELGELAAKKLFELEPHNPANYVTLMNLYSDLNKHSAVNFIKHLMRERSVTINHTWSWIQLNNKVHIFNAVGKPHQEEGLIHFELHRLISEMTKKFGYIPDIGCVYQDIDATEKEKILLGHTEKLAITYGLMKTTDFATIRVIKNTRICSDCHTVAKYISFLRKREIILKDGLRIHHFSNGKCSCNGFW